MGISTKAILIGFFGLAAVGGLAFVGAKWFAPQAEQSVDQAILGGGAARQLGGGAFEGADPTHEVTGTVALYQDPEGYFLRFEDYDATSGPAVYFFLSSDASGKYDERTSSKLLVPGGQPDGQATLRGNFNIRLGGEIDPDELETVIVLCERFSVTFGAARVGS